MTIHIIYDCGICDHSHPWDWDGDCREDAHRYAGYEDYAERMSVPVNDVEVRTWEERLVADQIARQH